MKRFVALILACITLCLFGCSASNDEFKAPVNFYYITDPISYDDSSTVISPEIQESDGYDAPVLLLRKYLKRIPGNGFASPYPPGLDIISVEKDGNSAVILLNRSFARLTGSDLSIACACLTWTVCEYLEVDTIYVSSQDALIDGKESITLTKSLFNLLDQAMEDPSNS